MTTHKGPGGITLVLDETDSDTPAMVYSRDRKASATYPCAVDNAAVYGASTGDVDLTPSQLAWLGRFETVVDRAYTVARRGNPDYN
jgi:hypothetical protein